MDPLCTEFNAPPCLLQAWACARCGAGVKLGRKGGHLMTLINCGVFIAGLGGLGGYLLEHMLRLGPGFIRAADGDVFDETNLDRQLLSAPSQLGRPKAEAAAERAKLVAPGLDFEAVSEFLDGENCLRLLRGCALALDGLDNAESRYWSAAVRRWGFLSYTAQPQGYASRRGWSRPGAACSRGCIRRAVRRWTEWHGGPPLRRVRRSNAPRRSRYCAESARRYGANC